MPMSLVASPNDENRAQNSQGGDGMEVDARPASSGASSTPSRRRVLQYETEASQAAGDGGGGDGGSDGGDGGGDGGNAAAATSYQVAGE